MFFGVYSHEKEDAFFSFPLIFADRPEAVGSSRSHKIRDALKNTDTNRERVQHALKKKQKENNNRISFISIKIFGFLFGCSSCLDLA